MPPLISDVTERIIARKATSEPGASRFTKEGAGPQVVKAEIDRFIELLFKESEAYRLALKSYAGRYEVIGVRNAADILREVIERYMPDREQQTESQEDETEGQASE